MSRTGGRQGRARRVALPAGLAAAAVRLAYPALLRWPPGGAARWARTNHRGEPVTLLAGPAVTLAAIVASAMSRHLPLRTRAALVTAGAGAAAFGGYDDLAGNDDQRGLRGHLGALARGDVTTGVIKLGGLGATGLAAAALLDGSATDAVINAGLAAGGANLLNLFDLRPGRAIKVAVAAGGLTALGAAARAGEQPWPAAAPLGAAAAVLPEDLGERAMLGDLGANALGAMLGVAAGAALSRPARLGVLAGIAGLTAASEVVSFTAVIERAPVLRWLDMLGRRPAPAAPSSRGWSPPPAAAVEPGEARAADGRPSGPP